MIWNRAENLVEQNLSRTRHFENFGTGQIIPARLNALGEISQKKKLIYARFKLL